MHSMPTAGERPVPLIRVFHMLFALVHVSPVDAECSPSAVQSTRFGSAHSPDGTEIPRHGTPTADSGMALLRQLLHGLALALPGKDNEEVPEDRGATTTVVLLQ